MDAARIRLASALEWMIAAGFLAATLTVGSLIVRELRTARSPMPVVAEQPADVLPAGVPTRAISVPVLLLLDGKEVRVGDSQSQIATLLGTAAETGRESVERGPIGDRLTRAYEYAGTRFTLVFEPFESRGPLRVAAIYLH